jgi:hypothetical protein
MTDYDVINNGFYPRQPRYPVEMLDTTFVPCAVGTLQRGPEAIVNMIFKFNPGNRDHVSDMLIFKNRCEIDPFCPPGRAVIEFGCAGWENAPLIHFSAGKTGPNKAEAICRQFPCLQNPIRKP